MPLGLRTPAVSFSFAVFFDTVSAATAPYVVPVWAFSIYSLCCSANFEKASAWSYLTYSSASFSSKTSSYRTLATRPWVHRPCQVLVRGRLETRAHNTRALLLLQQYQPAFSEIMFHQSSSFSVHVLRPTYSLTRSISLPMYVISFWSCCQKFLRSLPKLFFHTKLDSQACIWNTYLLLSLGDSSPFLYVHQDQL